MSTVNQQSFSNNLNLICFFAVYVCWSMCVQEKYWSLSKETFNVDLSQWCSNYGPQGPLEWLSKQFSLERKLNTLII